MNKTSGFSCSAGELNSLAVLAYNLIPIPALVTHTKKNHMKI